MVDHLDYYYLNSDPSFSIDCPLSHPFQLKSRFLITNVETKIKWIIKIIKKCKRLFYLFLYSVKLS